MVEFDISMMNYCLQPIPRRKLGTVWLYLDAGPRNTEIETMTDCMARYGIAGIFTVTTSALVAWSRCGSAVRADGRKICKQFYLY